MLSSSKVGEIRGPLKLTTLGIFDKVTISILHFSFHYCARQIVLCYLDVDCGLEGFRDLFFTNSSFWFATAPKVRDAKGNCRAPVRRGSFLTVTCP